MSYTPSYPPPRPAIFQRGNQLAIQKGLTLPECCIKCGAPATGRPIKRNLQWHPPWVSVLILVAVLIYIIVAMVLRKTGTIYVHMCEEHRQRRKIILLVGWITTPGLLIGGIAAGIYFENGGLAALGFLGFVVSLIVFLIIGKLVHVAEIDDQYVYLKKIAPNVMSNLCQGTPIFSHAFPIQPSATQSAAPSTPGFSSPPPTPPGFR